MPSPPATDARARRHLGHTAKPSGVPTSTLAALMLAVFTVSAGYGVVLPLLPFSIDRLVGAGTPAVQVSRNVGLVTAIYTLALFLFAPVWGRFSDRRGRRSILVVGPVGLGATMLAFSWVETLWGVYTERFLSGMFAAAVTPVGAAAIAPLSESRERLCHFCASSIGNHAFPRASSGSAIDAHSLDRQ